MKLYACFWNSNGTNDLLAVDESGMIVDTLEEGLYGFDIMSGKLAVALDGILYSYDDFDAQNIDSTICCEISLFTAIARRACSHVDMEGTKTIEFINKITKTIAA